MSSINQDDEVVIPSPYWVSYPDIVSLCRGKSVLIESESKNEFKITPQMLEKKLTKIQNGLSLIHHVIPLELFIPKRSYLKLVSFNKQSPCKYFIR